MLLFRCLVSGKLLKMYIHTLFNLLKAAIKVSLLWGFLCVFFWIHTNKQTKRGSTFYSGGQTCFSRPQYTLCEFCVWGIKGVASACERCPHIEGHAAVGK